MHAVSQAWRSWSNAKSIAILAIVAFAIGIGSATAIYTVVNGVLLKPLPYAHADRFVALYTASLTDPDSRGALVFPHLIAYRERTRSFDVFGWFRRFNATLTNNGQPMHVVALGVTPSLAHNLGVSPIVGQWFTGEDGLVLSYGLWRRLGSDPGIVGTGLLVDGRPITVTGVMPPSFRLPAPGPGLERGSSDLWLYLDPLGKGQDPQVGLNFAYGRLREGVTLAEAEADVKRVAEEIKKLDSTVNPSYSARLDGLRANIILEIRPTLVLLIVAAAVLLLIACADIAGLLLSRAVARARETAIRVALGAGRWQLAAHYFVESLLLAIPGALAGLTVSFVLVRLVTTLAAEHIPRADEISLDWSVLLFAVAVTTITSALASLAPLWQALRTAPSDVLNEGVRATASARTRRLSRGLVVAEIALAFALLTAGGVLVAHLRSLGRVVPGFNTANLLTFQINAETKGETPAARAQYHARYIAAIEAIPGVSSAAFSNQLPLAGCCFSTVMYPEGRTTPPASVDRTVLLAVSPGYIRTLEIPLRSGRLTDDRDLTTKPLPVVVNEAAARVNWPEGTALGAFGRLGAPDGSRFQVVGIVGNIRNDALNKPTVPELYLSAAIVSLDPLRFAVRSTRTPAQLLPEIRSALAKITPTQAIHNVATMTEIIERSISLPQIGSFMLLFFALSALFMAALGIFGVVSYAVRQGTVEIGTRLALGAIGRDLLTMLVGNGLRMAVIGAAIGVVAAAAGSWLLMRAFGIQTIAVLPFVVSTVVVGAISVAASFFPAWRATRLSPMAAIRSDARATRETQRQTLLQTLRGVPRAILSGDDARPSVADDLVTDLIGAARRASSFPEAFHLALAMLRQRLGAASALLLERRAGAFAVVASSPEDAPHPSVLENGFLVRRLRAYTHSLPMTAADLQGWLLWAREQAPEHVGEIESLIASGMRLAIGIRAKGEVQGVLLLGAPQDRTAYTADERSVLRPCAEQLALMLENARLTARVVEQEKLRRDLALAAEVQKRLLPERPPDRDVAALAAVSLPARSVGGDYYDFIDLGDQRIGIALADVAGKGIAAALLMAVVQASLRIVAADGRASLPELAEKINGFLHRSTGANSYATFFYAQLDEATRQLTYVNAGHNPPYLFRQAEIQELNVGGTVLGLFPQMTYEQATVELRAGDVLVAFTDGVTEALNSSDEEFGETRLKELLRGVMHLPAAEISTQIAAELRRWIKDTTQYDDLTFVVLKVN